LVVGLSRLHGDADTTVGKEGQDEARRQCDFEVSGHRFNVQAEFGETL
jgi:hypothetical protein